MKNLKIKICGMGDPEIMDRLAKLEIDMLGFIFYPKSPRFVEGKISPKQIEALPHSIDRVGVFVNETSEKVMETCSRYHLNCAQLHGTETPETCQTIKDSGLKVFKAFSLKEGNTLPNFNDYEDCCDLFIFDTPSAQHGGTGEKFDWSLLDDYKGTIPFLLSGGIGPNDVDAVLAVKHKQMLGVDINSRFETSPGIKDDEQIEKFIAALNNYNN